MDDAHLARWAGRQHGVITRKQANGLGLSDDQIDWRVRNRLLVPVHAGVFRHGAHPPDPASQLMAAVLACNATAVVSHRSAAQLHDLRDVPRWRPEVMVLGTRLPVVPGVLVHRTRRLDPVDVTSMDGIPTLALPTTLLTLGGVLPRRTARQAAEDALLRNLVTDVDLLCVLERLGRRGRPGTAALREVLGTTPDALQSRLELDLYRLLVDCMPEKPELQHRVVLPDGSEAYLDFAYPASMVAVEAEGRRWHSTTADFERDLRRSRGITALGWRHYRYGWVDVHQRPEQVRAELRGVLQPVS